MSTIKAIETEYAGCKFRSRLEARWAVFFDHAGIRWQHEPDGLTFGGIAYLPDFMVWGLPGSIADFDLIEVKAPYIVATAHKAAVAINRFVDGDHVTGRFWSAFDIHGGYEHSAFAPLRKPIELGRAGQAIWVVGEITHRAEVLECDDGGIEPYLGQVWLDGQGAACAAARSARFEFGETPPKPQRHWTQTPPPPLLQPIDSERLIAILDDIYGIGGNPMTIRDAVDALSVRGVGTEHGLPFGKHMVTAALQERIVRRGVQIDAE